MNHQKTDLWGFFSFEPFLGLVLEGEQENGFLTSNSVLCIGGFDFHNFYGSSFRDLTHS